jgi:hypothetical protein
MTDVNKEIMEKDEFKKRKPDYISEGIAIWKNIAKDGQEYLTVKMLGHNTVTAFAYKPKEKDKK